ncbi:hypothetical protein HY091_02840 [Candidatus Kaiserbacteria bacterium]|nr:hypothetical protein [Candidatus Kaiserbacteria bacterium]
MTDQPLQPFAPPFSVNLSSGSAVEWLLGIAFALWLLFTLIAIYHWLKYSHASLIAFPAIFVHLAVSAALMSYALTGAVPLV